MAEEKQVKVRIKNPGGFTDATSGTHYNHNEIMTVSKEMFDYLVKDKVNIEEVKEAK